MERNTVIDLIDNVEKRINPQSMLLQAWIFLKKKLPNDEFTPLDFKILITFDDFCNALGKWSERKNSLEEMKRALYKLEVV